MCIREIYTSFPETAPAKDAVSFLSRAKLKWMYLTTQFYVRSAIQK